MSWRKSVAAGLSKSAARRRRRAALFGQPADVLQGYLDTIRIREGAVALVLARESIDVWNAAIFRARIADGEFFDPMPKLRPRPWPRLERRTVEALDNPKLLAAYDLLAEYETDGESSAVPSAREVRQSMEHLIAEIRRKPPPVHAYPNPRQIGVYERFAFAAGEARAELYAAEWGS